MDKKLDYIITLLGGKGQTPTKDQVQSMEKMEDGEKINEDVDVDVEAQMNVDVEAKLNVDVWNSEEKGVHEHFEAQLDVDDKIADEGHTPAEKVIQNLFLSLSCSSIFIHKLICFVLVIC